jgi:hypothetical protein
MLSNSFIGSAFISTRHFAGLVPCTATRDIFGEWLVVSCEFFIHYSPFTIHFMIRYQDL